MSHTPGPWTVSRHGAILGSTTYDLRGGTVFLQVALATLDERDAPERDANAHLIAAAPELLEALRLAIVIIGHPDDAAMQAMRKVVAKAEGKQ